MDIIGGNLGVESWNRMLADLMESSSSGTCGGAALCYVNIRGEKKLLDIGEQYADGCTVYTCEVGNCFIVLKPYLSFRIKNAVVTCRCTKYRVR